MFYRWIMLLFLVRRPYSALRKVPLTAGGEDTVLSSYCDAIVSHSWDIGEYQLQAKTDFYV